MNTPVPQADSNDYCARYACEDGTMFSILKTKETISPHISVQFDSEETNQNLLVSVSHGNDSTIRLEDQEEIIHILSKHITGLQELVRLKITGFLFIARPGIYCKSSDTLRQVERLDSPELCFGGSPLGEGAQEKPHIQALRESLFEKLSLKQKTDTKGAEVSEAV